MTYETASNLLSTNVTLVAGQAYYMEGIWKENTGGDGFAMMFREAGNATVPGNTEFADGRFFQPILWNALTNPGAATPTPVRVQVFSGISGTTVSTLTNAAKFIANAPDIVVNMPSFSYNEALGNSGLDNYGARLSAYFVAPSNGFYRFFLRSDDESQIFMNTNGMDPNGKVSIAYLPNFRPAYTNVTAAQTMAGVTNTGVSMPIQLTNGQLYYLEALFKEGSGGDGVALTYRWFNTLADSTNLVTIPPTAEILQAANLRPIITNLNTFGYSTPYAPFVLAEIYQNNASGVGGTAVSDFLNHTKFQSGTPDLTLPMAYFGWNRDIFGSQLSGDNYGVRVSAYFVAPSNATYRFFLRCDDGATLYMNTNGVDAGGKVSIASAASSHNTYANNDGTMSPAINLTNGQRYYMELLLKEATGNDGASVAFFTTNLLGAAFPTAPPVTAVASADFFSPTFGPPTANAIAMSTSATTLNDGQTVTFTVNGVTGANPMGYLWRKNGQIAAGTYNGNSFTYTVTPADIGVNTFSVQLLNPQGSVERFVNLTLNAVNVDASAPYITGVIGNGLQNEVTVTYSENVLASTATNIANYSIPGLTIYSAFMRNSSNQIALLTSAQTPGTRYTLTASGIVDMSRAGNVILPGTSFSFTSWNLSRGYVTVDLFTGLNSSGATVPYLQTEPKFLNNTPDQTSYTNGFGFNAGLGANFTDQYGARVYGWFVPPSNGLYRFYIRSDDYSALFMNTNGTDPNGKIQIATVDLACCKNYGDLTAGPALSSNIFLNGGQPYYLEALLRDATGNDGVAVAFREAGDSSTPPNSEIIPGYYFMNLGNPDLIASLVITNQPASVSAAVGSVAYLAVGVYAQFNGPTYTPVYQWQQRVGGNWVSLAPGPFPYATNFLVPLNCTAAGITDFRAIVSLPGVSVTSAVATVTVTNVPPSGGLTVPSLLWASCSTNGTTITAQFSEPVTSATANNTANYTLVDQASTAYTISGVALQADAKTVVLTVSTVLAAGNVNTYTLTAVNIVCVDDAQVGGGTVNFWVPTGTMRYDLYTNFFAGTLPSVMYTHTPVTNNLVTNAFFFAAGTYANLFLNGANSNYAARVAGYFIPPSNGMYRFYMASDDGSQLWMNTNLLNGASPTGKVQLINVPGANLGYYNSNSQSPYITLQGGQRYYTEALVANGTGGEYLVLAMREFNDTTLPPNGSPSTERVSLRYFSLPATLTIVGTGFTQNEGATNAVLGTVIGTPAAVQWYSNNVLIAGATNATLALPSPLPLSYNGARFEIIATNSFSGVVSNEFTMSVTADATAPAIVGVSRCNTWTNLYVNFSELIDPVTATNLANYVVADSLGNIITLVNITLRPDGRSVQLSIAPSASFDPTQVYYVTNAAIADRSAAVNTVTPGVSTYNALTFSTNFIGLDFYTNIASGSLTTLSNDVRFINNLPDYQQALAGFDFRTTNMPFVGQGSYATRSYGWFVAPSNGYYRFWFRSDDLTTVNMNTAGESPSGKINIGGITACCNGYTGTTPVQLNGGSRYFIEFLAGQGGSQEYFQATWAGYADLSTATAAAAPYGPGANMAGWSSAGYHPSAEIGGAINFGLYGDPTIVSNFNFTLQPVALPGGVTTTNVPAGGQVRFGVAATSSLRNNGYIFYQWQADDGSGNFTNVGPAATYTSDFEMLGNRSNYVASFFYPTTLRCVAMLPGGLSVTSSTVNVTVTEDLTVSSFAVFGSPNTNFIRIAYNKPVRASDALETLYNLVYIDGNAITVELNQFSLSPDGRVVTIDMRDTLLSGHVVAVDIGPVQEVSGPSTYYGYHSALAISAEFAADIGSGPGTTDPILRSTFFPVGNNGFDLAVGGSDIWNAADGMFYLGRQVTGDFDVRLRVASMTNSVRGLPDANAKAGFVARVSTNANSRMVSAIIAPPVIPGWPVAGANVWQVNYRDATGGSSATATSTSGAWQPGGTPWIRLVRRGLMLIGLRSVDGTNWFAAGSRDTAVNGGAYPETIYLGLAAASHNNTTNFAPSVLNAALRDIYFPAVPTITAQPSGATLAVGQSVTLSVTASNPANSGALTYQWKRNGLNIVGANSSSLALNNVSVGDAGGYTVIVGNDGGGVLSATATVTVNNTGPVVTPEAVTVVQNRATNFTSGTLLGNDSDPEGRALSIAAVSGIAPVTFFTDFESGLPAGSSVLGIAHITNGVGVGGGNALALTDAIGSQNGAWVIDDLVPGYAVSAFSASFKVRLGDGSANAADGFSFNLATDTPAVVTSGSEEGAGSGLSICFDNYNNGNFEAPALDVKWRGQVVAHVPINKIQSAAWQDVTVTLRGDGTLDVYLTNAPLVLGVQTGYVPMSGAKWSFFSRTGGEFETHWLDDVSITVFSSQTTANQGGSSTFSYDFNSGLPAGAYVFGNAGAVASGGVGGSGYLRINDGVANQSGSLLLPEQLPGRPIQSFTASFAMRIADTSAEAADGWSFNFAPDLPFVNAVAAGNEEGAGNGLSFCYDGYRANGSANNSAFRIKWNGVQLAAVTTPTWNNTAFIPVQITLNANGSVTLNVNGTNVVSNLATPYTPRAGRFGIYGRSGGSFESHWVDNLSITLNTVDSVFMAGGNVYYTPPTKCGTDTIYYLVTDGQGGSAVDSATVSLMDVTAPVIAAPATNLLFFANAGCQAVLPDLLVSSGLVITDNCAVVSTSQSPLPGTLISTGVTVVTITALDEWFNMVTTNISVTNIDVTAPTISCTATTLAAGPGVCYALNSSLALPTAADNCGIAVLTNDAPAQLTVGNYQVVWTAIDGAGNSTTATQAVTVVDTQVPQIACAANVSVAADLGQCFATGVTLGSPITSDNCGIASVVNNALSQYPIGVTTVTWIITDVNGNTNFCQQLVTVTDTQAPTIAAPANITVAADTNECFASGVVLGSPVVGDNCGIASVTSNAPAQFPIGSNAVVWTVTDVNGLTATATQVVTVTESLPIIIAQPLGTNVFVGSSVSLTVSVFSCSSPIYQWYRGATAVADATNASLVFSNIASCDAGDYTVIITNAVGVVTSEVAVVFVTNAPAVIAPGGALTAGTQNDCGPLILAPGAVYNWDNSDAGGVAGTGWDLITAGTGIDVQATVATPFTVNLISLGAGAANFNNNATSSWTIASAPDGVTNFAANKFVVNDSAFANDLGGGAFSIEEGSLKIKFTPNHAPVAPNLGYTRGPGTTLKIRISDLLTNVTDSDGDLVTLLSVSNSTNGVAVTTNDTFIFYSSTTNVTDAFTYTVRDTHAYRVGDTMRTATGTIVVTVTNTGGITPNIVSITVSGGKPTIRFAGIPGYGYDVQRATDLTPPISWTTIHSTNAPAGGLFEYTDENPPLGAAYYRTAQQP